MQFLKNEWIIAEFDVYADKIWMLSHMGLSKKFVSTCSPIIAVIYNRTHVLYAYDEI